MDKHTICLLNDSFPPIIDGVANAVVNYAENIEKHHGHAVVVTPAVPGADDSGFPFPVVRYPSIDTRRLVGYVAGYPFSPETALRVREEKVELLHTHCPIASAILARSLREVVDAPLVLTYHTKYDIDIAKAVKSRLLQESAIRALVQNVNACDEVWVVSRGAGENLRSLGYEGAYTVMENGVDVPRGRVSAAAVAAATAGYDLPDGVPLFLFVGRLMWYKGLHIILDALRALREQGQDFRMVFIGAGGDEKEVRAEVETLRLSDRCFFTGSIADRETLREMEKVFAQNGVQTETVLLGNQAIRGCTACGACAKLGRCVFDDAVNELAPKLEAADGLVVASPVYYASANATLIACLDRLFYSTPFDKTMKVGASVVCARRGGCSATFDELNKYFTISGMPIASSQYWNSVHGRAAGEAAMDAEGLQTMRTLARNMTFLMKSIALGRETFGLPEQEERVATHFIP